MRNLLLGLTLLGAVSAFASNDVKIKEKVEQKDLGVTYSELRIGKSISGLDYVDLEDIQIKYKNMGDRGSFLHTNDLEVLGSEGETIAETICTNAGLGNLVFVSYWVEIDFSELYGNNIAAIVKASKENKSLRVERLAVDEFSSTYPSENQVRQISTIRCKKTIKNNNKNTLIIKP